MRAGGSRTRSLRRRPALARAGGGADQGAHLLNRAIGDAAALRTQMRADQASGAALEAAAAPAASASASATSSPRSSHPPTVDANDKTIHGYQLGAVATRACCVPRSRGSRGDPQCRAVSAHPVGAIEVLGSAGDLPAAAADGERLALATHTGMIETLSRAGGKARVLARGEEVFDSFTWSPR
jgi:hypothetical protein